MSLQQSMIKSIAQLDNHSFAITWDDGSVRSYRLSTLQRACPCAGCSADSHGQPRLSAVAVDENVRAVSLHTVGRYALKIQFASGCSSGIYSCEYLRKL
jgi:ATP-binding protein involved in chromosome partitioning